MADKNHLHRATTTRVVYVANFFLFLFCQKSFKNSTSIALDTLNKMIMKLIQFKKKKSYFKNQKYNHHYKGMPLNYVKVLPQQYGCPFLLRDVVGRNSMSKQNKQSIFFRQITTFIKVGVAFVFGLHTF